MDNHQSSTFIHNMVSNNESKYYCTMHCEGDKAYDKPGNCPVCGMHLMAVMRTSKIK